VMENDSFIFLKKIAKALILRALLDLRFKKTSYRFITARNFCLGLGVWRESLLTWCEVADIDYKLIQKKAEEYINANRN